MYGRLDSRHIPDVEDNDVSHTQSQRGVDREFRPEYSRPGSIASREPPATSTRDYANAATERGTGASFYRKEELLEDVREHVGDFAEWRMDYSRQLARQKDDTRQAEESLRQEWGDHQREQAQLERRLADWSRENGFASDRFPSDAQPTPSTAGATSTFRARQPGENQREAGTVGVAGVGRWELQELLVGRNRIPTCQLELGQQPPPPLTWQSARCVRVEPPMADFAIVNAESVRDAVGVILRGNTGASIIDQIMRVQHAGAIGVAIINTSSEKFNPDAVEQELAPEAAGVRIPVVVIRDIDGETIPRRATISVLHSHKARRTESRTESRTQAPPRSAEHIYGETETERQRRKEPPVQPVESRGLDREAVLAMALKLGRRLTETETDRAMREMGGHTEVPYDAFCQWWAEETVRVRTERDRERQRESVRAIETEQYSHTATHERLSKQMAMPQRESERVRESQREQISPARPRATSPRPQQQQQAQADGSAVQAALIQAGIDPDTSMQVLRGLERSGKIRPGSSPRRVTQRETEREEEIPAEEHGDWLTASEEDTRRSTQRSTQATRATQSSGAARRLRKVQGVKSAVSRRTHLQRDTQRDTHRDTHRETERERHSPYSPPVYSAEGNSERDREATSNSFRELYSGYPPQGQREPQRERAKSPPQSARKHRSERDGQRNTDREQRSRRKDKKAGERSRKDKSRDRETERQRDRHRRSARRAARHVTTDSSTVRSPRDKLTPAQRERDREPQRDREPDTPPYSEDEEGYSPVLSERHRETQRDTERHRETQDPRVLQQVDELCQSIPTFAGMTARERKLMVEVLQPFTAEPGAHTLPVLSLCPSLCLSLSLSVSLCLLPLISHSSDTI